MRAFHLILFDDHSPAPRRVDFDAEGPDHAFQIARNETAGTEVELWEGRTLLARLTKAGGSLWKLHGTSLRGTLDSGERNHRVAVKAMEHRGSDR